MFERISDGFADRTMQHYTQGRGRRRPARELRPHCAGVVCSSCCSSSLPVVALLVAQRAGTDRRACSNYAELLGVLYLSEDILQHLHRFGLVTIVSLAIGFPVAWLLAIMPQRLASDRLCIILLLSMWTNLLARTYAWMVLLAAHGRHQQDVDGAWPDRPAAAAGQQPDRRHHRHDLYHAALHHPAALRRHPQDRPGHPAGGRAVRRHALAGV